MAFNSFTCIDDVVKKYKLHYVPAPLLPPDPTAPVFDDHFRGELAFNFRKLPIGRSEIGSGEFLLFPILREVWKPYADELALFSHEGLTCDDLTGVPDYFVCEVSEYGQTIPGIPHLLVVEAKLDDFEKAWGQCAAAMLAAQKLNVAPDSPVYGVATNGKSWEFGCLLNREFTIDPVATATADLDSVSQRLHAVLRAARAAALGHAASAAPPVTAP